MVSDPMVICELCKRSVTVTPDGRGFPPSIAQRKLKRKCAAAGCPCLPKYRAGIGIRGRPQGQ